MYVASVSPSLRAIGSIVLSLIGPLPSPETCVSRSLIVTSRCGGTLSKPGAPPLPPAGRATATRRLRNSGT